MAINFPDTPTLNQTVTDGTSTWICVDATEKIWDLVPTEGPWVKKAGDTMTGELDVVSPTGATSVGVRQIWFSDVAPAAGDGADGDVWVVRA